MARGSVAALLYVCAVSLVNSRTGRAMKAIRDNAIAAGAMGVNVSLYKSLTFGVSALYTGIAGALGAVVAGFVAPDSFTFTLSIQLFVGLVVGGVGSIPGTRAVVSSQQLIAPPQSGCRQAPGQFPCARQRSLQR